MRLSPSTVALLGKLTTVFQDKLASRAYHSDEPALVLSEGVILAWRLDDLFLSIVDAECSPELAVTASADALLRMMAGLKGRAEIIVGDGYASLLAAEGGELKLPVGSTGGPLLGFEGCERNYEVTDVAAFHIALQECVAGAHKDVTRPKLHAVHLDGGEALSSDGHKLTVRYIGVDVKACLPMSVAQAWLKMLAAYKGSKGGWWVRQSEGRVALMFRHFKQEVTLAGYDRVAEEGPSAATFRKTLANNSTKDAPVVQVNPYVSTFVKLFDFVAIYRNGEVIGWRKGHEYIGDNGNTGPIPAGQKPLAILASDVAGKLLAKAKRNFGPITMSFFGGALDESTYEGAKLGDDLIMGCKAQPPELPADCYTQLFVAAEEAA